MKTILRVCGCETDELMGSVNHLPPSPDVRVENFDLSTAEPDYEALLEAVFRADVAQVWRREP
jgi:hypothetical protein